MWLIVRLYIRFSVRLDLGKANITGSCDNSSSDSMKSAVTLSWEDKTVTEASHTISLTSVQLE